MFDGVHAVQHDHAAGVYGRNRRVRRDTDVWILCRLVVLVFYHVQFCHCRSGECVLAKGDGSFLDQRLFSHGLCHLILSVVAI